MQEHYSEITALGADALGISIGADYQAEHLMANGIEFELLVDPDGNFKSKALGVGRLRLWTYLLPTVWWKYIKWAFAARQGKPAAGLGEPPAVAIIDADGVARYVYKGETLGDYPPMDEVMARLREVAGG